MNIFVFSENVEFAAELIGLANALNNEVNVSAFALGQSSEDKLAAIANHKVYALGDLGDKIVDDMVPTMAAVVKAEKPDVVLVGATAVGRIVAGKLAAALGTSAVVNAKSISVGEKVEVTHLVYGGGAVRVDKAVSDTAVVTVSRGAAEPAAPHGGKAEVAAVEFVAPAVTVKKVNTVVNKTGGSNILTAKKVVGCGRGFYTSEDLQYAKDFAEAIDGTLGYSRPVTEVEPPIAEGEPYIGVSGITIKPDVYFAVALSGQTQHMIGVADAKVIVCINKETDGPIGKASDYIIKGDYKEILPALTKAAKI